jgi:glycosyltransferase involved in cell wall biosynthesis
MKIVDITSLYSRNGGGIRTYLREKGRRLAELGHQVHRIVPGEARASHRDDDGVTEHTLSGPPLPFDRNYRLFASFDEIGDLLHQLSPDVVEVGSHYFLPWRIRQLAPRRTRIVGFFHSNVPETFVTPAVARWPASIAAAAQRTAWRIVRAMHAHYDATLCASRFVEAQLHAHEVPRVVRVGLGVDLRRFPRRDLAATPPRRGQVCYLGRLSGDKEAELLLRAAPALAAAGHLLQVAGDGPMAKAFARARHLTYLGPLPSAQVGELLRGSEACLVPGRHETFSFAAAEALACGTPVVCPEHGAAAELVQRSGCGTSFATGDVAALVAAVAHSARASLAARRAAAQSARTFVERELSWAGVVDRLLAVYRGEPTVTETSTPTIREHVA